MTMHSPRIGPALLLTVVLLASSAVADPPPGYYDSVDTSSAAAQRLSLHDVIDDHTRFPYTAATTDTWVIINEADEDPDNPAAIVDLYKNASYEKIGGGTGAYNREHTWPKSYGFPTDGQENSPYTDCHHLFAADAGYNSSRSNKPYRYCTASCTEKPTEYTNGRGGGSGTYPGNSNWTQGAYTDGTWETWTGRRGDVARALFYLAIRYEGGTHALTGVHEPDLELTDSTSLIASSNTGENEEIAYMGILADLLAWHDEDPVDARERRRNDIVMSYQGNRNPFIDHPAWARCIFLGACDPDTEPPSPPTGLDAHGGSGAVMLSWNQNHEPDLHAYSAYRSQTTGGPYTHVASTATTEYTDHAVTGQTTYYYVVTASDTAGNESEPSTEAAATPATGTSSIILSEVLYDIDGSDDGLEWVELFNAGTTAVNLANYSLGNGGSDYTYSTAQLAGTIQPGSTFVVGGPSRTAANSNPSYDQVVNFDPDLQNSGSDADGVALFNVRASQITPTTVPVDAVIYGPTNSNGLIDETGQARAPEVGDVDPGRSIERASLAGTWRSQAVPTPNRTHLAPTNTPPTVAITSPTSGTTVTAGETVTFRGTATDTEDGSLSASIAWSSSRDGALGTGSPVSANLSTGTHTITAQITDSGGLSATDTISITIAANTPPAVAITAPNDGATFTTGQSITFRGTAADVEDGSLNPSLSWTSDRDGALGTGSPISADLSTGTHAITARATDSGGLTGTDTISITVTATSSCPHQSWIEIASHGPGAAGSTWRTDVTSRNPGSTPTEVAYILHTATTTSSMTTTLEPGAQAAFEDLVGLLGLEGTGALEICADQPVRSVARIYNRSAEGTFGQAFRGFTRAEGISQGETAQLLGLRQLTDTFRTNLSVTNTGTTTAGVTIRLFDALGVELHQYALSVPPGQVVQDGAPFAQRAGRPDIGWGFATVTVDTGAGILASGSVIDSRTNDATTIPMMR